MAGEVKRAKAQYQDRDNPVVDYELFELPGFPYMLRGPSPVAGKDFISVIGAGQSFGVLVRKPYVHDIRKELGVEVLNLSVGGSAPTLYLQNKLALERCNESKVCIVQALSARSTVSSYFETESGKNMLRPRGSKLPFVPGDTAFDMMFQMEPPMVSELVVKEIQANWVKEMSGILRAIKVPKILLWFSKRKPEGLGRNYTSYRAASGVFPQFVNRAMMDEILPLADDYVEVASSRGVPNKLTSRFTGEPTTVILGDHRKPAGEDHYYPSPEMHEDAFAALRAPLAKLLQK
jgi:hypothetical protein